AVGVLHRAAGTRDAPAGDERAAHEPRGLRDPLRDERILAPEALLLPADGPRGAGHDRGDVGTELVAVQRVAHLRAKGVPRAEATGQALEGGHRLRERVPQRLPDRTRRHELVALLPRVPGP